MSDPEDDSDTDHDPVVRVDSEKQNGKHRERRPGHGKSRERRVEILHSSGASEVADPKDMNIYYDDERIKKYGALAIEIELIK